MHSRDTIEKGLLWRIGNGKTVQFWVDKWLPEGPLSCNSLVTIPPSVDLNQKVEDFVIADRWDLQSLNSLLPPGIVDSIKVIPLSHREDKLIWGPSSDGRFSVKSTYELLIQSKSLVADKSKEWDLVWKLKTIPRIKSFVWLCRHANPRANLTEERVSRVFRESVFSATFLGSKVSCLLG